MLLLVGIAACASGHKPGAGDDDDTAAIDAGDDPADAGPPDSIPCTPDPDGEQCNGNDDDCDGHVDEGFPGVGMACSAGTGACANPGVTQCKADGTGTECGAQPLTPGDELCDTGADEDCDGMTDEGFDNLGDTCSAGQFSCARSGHFICSPNQLTTVCDAVAATPGVETCNGADEDCDGVNDNGFQINQACDGTGDTDLCQEGVWACNGSGGRVCLDNTTSTVELCNGDAVDENCDGNIDEGYAVHDTAVCTSTFNIGSASGDTGSATLTDSWYNDEFDIFRLTENDNGVLYLSAHIDLYSPPGVDYDLYVYCESCSAVIGSSINGGLTGHHDTFDIRNDDDYLFTDDFNVLVEIRYYASNRCAPWTLTVTANTAASTDNCDP